MVNKQTHMIRLSMIAAIMIVLAVFIKLSYWEAPPSIIVLVAVLVAGAVILTLVNIYILFKYRTPRESA
jgi:hypothetical protein